MSEAADRTVREPTVDYFEVPLCTETLNTTAHRLEALTHIRTLCLHVCNNLSYLIFISQQFPRQKQLEDFILRGMESCDAHGWKHKELHYRSHATLAKHYYYKRNKYSLLTFEFALRGF